MPQKNKASNKITANTPIFEIAMKYPKALPVLFDYGFHCIGCQLSAYETIEAGAAAHGLDKKQIQTLIAKLNKAIESK
ncbi:MAG: DUF1858 domain-containing protein [Candidatus Anstonellales archaeon]